MSAPAIWVTHPRDAVATLVPIDCTSASACCWASAIDLAGIPNGVRRTSS